MQEQAPKDFRASFLLMLTKEMIENTEAYKSLRIKKEVKEFIIRERKGPELAEGARKEEIKELIRGKIKRESEKISEMGKVGLLPELRMISRPVRKFTRRRAGIEKIPPILKIPEPELPETVRYLKPVPTSEEMDLANLNILVKDPLVKIIECNGPDENILVMGMMGRRSTPIKLSKEEIDEILEKFSGVSRIPLHEGLFKAAVGNLIISAVISEIVGIKFVIRKISREF
ncbi:MAG TPA: hypothetical protein VJ142_02755 [Candidatus Nanoarchaeia archaeon]|nr:hypothetical protein [Candidatus Nanoarchaeia archaeon]